MGHRLFPVFIKINFRCAFIFFKKHYFLKSNRCHRNHSLLLQVFSISYFCSRFFLPVEIRMKDCFLYLPRHWKQHRRHIPTTAEHDCQAGFETFLIKNLVKKGWKGQTGGLNYIKCKFKYYSGLLVLNDSARIQNFLIDF